MVIHMTIRDVPCPRCGNLMSKHEIVSHNYYFCLKFGDKMGGCNVVYTDNPDCYFDQIYIITPQGELVGYKEAGKFIKTKTFLPGKWGKRSD
jgi:hypothetical protein